MVPRAIALLPLRLNPSLVGILMPLRGLRPGVAGRLGSRRRRAHRLRATISRRTCRPGHNAPSAHAPGTHGAGGGDEYAVAADLPAGGDERNVERVAVVQVGGADAGQRRTHCEWLERSGDVLRLTRRNLERQESGIVLIEADRQNVAAGLHE